MKWNGVFVAGVVLASAFVVLAPARAETQARNRPNFLIIVADDMGFADAGCYGGEISTPSLDRLAAGGVRFTNFYSTARCWPSRACILTGYYAQQVRMDPPRGPLPEWTRVLPHYLKPLGYRCYHSGKWHLRGAPKPVADGGFDHSYMIDDHNRFFSPQKHEEDDQPLPPVKPDSGFYLTNAIADHAIRCLKEHSEKHRDRPFFQYLCFTSPHFPLHALPEDIARYRERYVAGWDAIREARWRRQREMGLLDCALSPRDPKAVAHWSLSEKKLQEQIGPGESGHAVAWDRLTDEQKRFQATKMAVHAAMIDRMDRNIGRVLEQLEAMGELDKTAIFFVSDNGTTAEQIIRGDGHDPAAEPGSAGSYLCLGPGWSTAGNTPFRLHKSWVHEGGISSPLIVHWPAGIKARGELRHTVGHFIDFVPTLLDLAGGTAGSTWNGFRVPPLPGRSLATAFARDKPIEREFLFFSHDGNHALRMDDWKLVALRTQPDAWELYDLKSDRGESNNLATEHPERVHAMAARFKELEAEFDRQAGQPSGRKARAGK
jgi:arylsulfatase